MKEKKKNLVVINWRDYEFETPEDAIEFYTLAKKIKGGDEAKHTIRLELSTEAIRVEGEAKDE